MGAENTVVTLNVAVETGGAVAGLAALTAALGKVKSELSLANGQALSVQGAVKASEDVARLRSEVKMLHSALAAQATDNKATLDKVVADHKSAMEKITAQQAAATAKRAADELATAEKAKQKWIQQSRDYQAFLKSGTGSTWGNTEAQQAQELAIWEMKQKAAAALIALQQERDVTLHNMATAEAARIQAITESRDVWLREHAASEAAKLQAVIESRDIALRDWAWAQAKEMQAIAESRDVWTRDHAAAEAAKLQAIVESRDIAIRDRAWAQAKEMQAITESRDLELHNMRVKAFVDQQTMNERMLKLDVDFATASAAARLKAAEKAQAYTLAGANASTYVGTAAAGMGNAAGIARLTKEYEDSRIAAGNAAGATSNHAAAMRDAHSAARGLAGAFNAMWLTWGNIVPLMAGFAFAASLKEAVTGFANVQYQMTFVKELAMNTTDSVKGLAEGMHEVATALGISPEKASEGLRALTQAGLDTTQALSVLPDVFKLATVGELGVKDAALATVGVLNSFGLGIGEAARVGDVMAKAGAMSATSVESMTQSMKYASVIAHQYGLEVEQVATVLTALGKRNITGTAAGTAVKNMMNEIYTQSGTQQKDLMKNVLQVSAYNLDGSRKELFSIVEDMKTKLREFDRESQGAILRKLFGERGDKSFGALMAMTSEEIQKTFASLKDASGFNADVFRQLQLTMKGQFELLKSDVSNLFAKIGEQSEGPVMDLLHNLRAAIADPTLREAVAGLTQSLAGIAKAVLLIGPPLLALWAAVKVTTALSIAMIGLQGATAAAAVAGKSLTSILLVNPVVAITAAVITLAGAYWLLHNREETLEQIHAREMTNADERIATINKETEAIQKKNRARAAGISVSDLEHNENIRDQQSNVDKLIAKRDALYASPDYAKDKEREGSLNPVTLFTYQGISGQIDSLNKQIRDTYTLMGKEKEALAKLKAARKVDAAGLEAERKAQQAKDDAVWGQGTKHVDLGAKRDAERNLSAEAKGYLDLYAFKEKLAKDNYKTEVDLAKSRLEHGLMTQREFSARRAEIEATYISESEKAYDSMDESISKKVAAAERESTRTALKNARERILGEQIIQEQADANTERIALQKANDKSAGESKKYIDKTLPAMSAKLKADQEAKWAGRDNGLMNPADKAASEAAIEVTKTYATELSAAEARLAILYAQTGRCTEATALLEEQIRATKDAMEEESAQAATAARKLVEYSNTAAFGMKSAITSYKNDVENVAAQTERFMTRSFKGMEDALVSFVKTGKLDFKSLATSIIDDLIRIQVQNSIMKPLVGTKDDPGILSRGLSGIATGASGFIKGLFNANGNVFASDSLHQYVNTIKSSPTLFRFAQGGAFGVFGEAGPEAVMPLTRGSDGNLGVRASGGGGVTISMPVTIDARGADPSVLPRIQKALVDLEVRVTKSIPAVIRREYASRGRAVPI